MWARMTWQTQRMVASLSGASSVASRKSVPVELRGGTARSEEARCERVFFFPAATGRPAEASGMRGITFSAFESRRGESDRFRDARLDWASSRNESSIVDSVRTNRASAPDENDPELGRGGRHPIPRSFSPPPPLCVHGAAASLGTSTDVSPSANRRFMFASISSKNARFSASRRSTSARSLASSSSAGLLHCVSRVSTS
mmetsp:Transcript_6356/g.19283  ORF Transcript_6356/g.19283 Transcript_6356/m.19283 type:complete len:200 (-) Transcript_6356:320-919(-)